ncbi:MAG: PIN domain-containing protein [Bacteroidota bacterium]|nr:PIN domain-containing protein [Bacteroidota bacterium]
MNLFIDTNIFLNFYHFSGDDLEELNKLLVLIKNDEITLFVPNQVVDEFHRNRDNKIADALKEFRKEKIEKQFPQMTKQYPEYKKLKETIKLFDENKQALLEKLSKDINTNSLKADIIISELFRNAKIINITKPIFNLAKYRHEIGNPPGKKDSYGDAINWEALLESVPDNEDIIFVTDDSDYLSELNNENFKPFLIKEWQNKKCSSIILFKTLTLFFKKNFPKIKLANEYEKTLLIEKLAKSGSFATTHSVLAQLSAFSDFSESEINDITLACISNNQIYWIATDYDVQENLKKIIPPNSHMINNDLYETFSEIYYAESETEENIS